MKSKLFCTLMVMVLMALVVSACAPAPTPEPTATATLEPTQTFTPEPTATNTPVPTKTPLPTATPNLQATEAYNAFTQLIAGYAEEGYITTTEGKLSTPKDYTNNWAQIGWYQWNLIKGFSASNFVLRTDIKWESASKSANPSGCGFVFRIQPNGDHYMIFVSIDGYVRSGINLDNGWRSMGQGYYGPGASDGSANLTLIMEDTTYRVLVNDKLIKTFTGTQGKLMTGQLAYTIVSGINTDFGTRCTFYNTQLWSINKK